MSMLKTLVENGFDLEPSSPGVYERYSQQRKTLITLKSLTGDEYIKWTVHSSEYNEFETKFSGRCEHLDHAIKLAEFAEVLLWHHIAECEDADIGGENLEF